LDSLGIFADVSIRRVALELFSDSNLLCFPAGIRLCTTAWYPSDSGLRIAGSRLARGKRPAKSDGALLVAASIVAAIRLRGEDIRPSPKLTVVVKDSIELARTVLAQLER